MKIHWKFIENLQINEFQTHRVAFVRWSKVQKGKVWEYRDVFFYFEYFLPEMKNQSFEERGKGGLTYKRPFNTYLLSFPKLVLEWLSHYTHTEAKDFCFSMQPRKQHLLLRILMNNRGIHSLSEKSYPLFVKSRLSKYLSSKGRIISCTGKD